MTYLIPEEKIEKRIFLIRGKKVMIDYDLAELYGVKTKVLLQSVKRNIERFPEDFMFRLIKEEVNSLRSQIVTLEKGRGKHRKYLPYTFTEQGVAMLSSVLRSKRAVQVNIQIMRIFTKLREIIGRNKEIKEKLNELEKRIDQHDSEIKSIFDAIYKLTSQEERPKRKVGFQLN